MAGFWIYISKGEYTEFVDGSDMGVREREGSKVSLKFQSSAKIITTFVDYLLTMCQAYYFY